jgi:hypothetical protein
MLSLHVINLFLWFGHRYVAIEFIFCQVKSRLTVIIVCIFCQSPLFFLIGVLILWIVFKTYYNLYYIVRDWVSLVVSCNIYFSYKKNDVNSTPYV